jgi:hypothetical protein
MNIAHRAPLDALDRYLGAVIEAYDGQGNHRSGTAVDHESAHWLVACARRLGVEAALVRLKRGASTRVPDALQSEAMQC